MRRYAQMPLPRHVHPLIKRLFEIQAEQRLSLVDIGERSGLAVKTMSHWRHNNAPQLLLFEAAANVLGYELCLRPKKETL